MKAQFHYAAADPKAIIPSLIIGSGITGALSMFFQSGMPSTTWWSFRTSSCTECSYVFSRNCNWSCTYRIINRCVKERS